MPSVVVAVVLLLIGLSGSASASRDYIRLPSEASRFFGRDGGKVLDNDDVTGTRWAVLIAGSNGYWNYRHQVIILPFQFQLISNVSNFDHVLLIFLNSQLVYSQVFNLYTWLENKNVSSLLFLILFFFTLVGFWFFFFFFGIYLLFSLRVHVSFIFLWKK